MIIINNKSSILQYLALALVMVITFLAFRPCLGNSFLYWDDDVHAWNNPTVKRLNINNLKQMFTATVNETYIPLTTLSFALEYSAGTDNPFLYHLDNLLGHMAVVALLFWLALLLGLNTPGAVCAALLFAIHPLHVESVAWITERKDILYSFFYILSIIAYIRWQRSSLKTAYVISVACCLLSMLAKPMALSLPLILVVIDRFFNKSVDFKSWANKIPYAVICASIGWITYSLHARAPTLDPVKAALTWAWTFMFYIFKFIWPHNLAPLYELPEPVAWNNPHFWMPAALFAVIAASIYIFRRNKWYLLAWAFYAGSVFFILRFDHSVDTEIVADRFMYLPSFGFCLLAGYLFEKGLKQLWLTALIAVFIFTLLGISTFRQTGIWKNDLTLWQHTLAINSQTPIAYNNIGNYFYKRNDQDNALVNYNKAIKIAPKLFPPYNNRGVIYYSRQQYALALNDFNTALALKKDAAAFNNRGGIYLMQMKLDEALADFNACLEINPHYNAGYYNRAEVYRLKGLHDLAIKDYSRALELDPKDKDSRQRLMEMK